MRDRYRRDRSIFWTVFSPHFRFKMRYGSTHRHRIFYDVVNDHFLGLEIALFALYQAVEIGIDTGLTIFQGTLDLEAQDFLDVFGLHVCNFRLKVKPINNWIGRLGGI